jgi:hypothetical protein
METGHKSAAGPTSPDAERRETLEVRGGTYDNFKKRGKSNSSLSPNQPTQGRRTAKVADSAEIPTSKFSSEPPK